MRCRKIISYLDAYVDGELSERRCRLVEAHLATCESCWRQVKDILRMNELLQGTLPVPPVPTGLAARITAEARRRQPVAIHENPSHLPVWNPLRLIVGLSTSMRLAVCATVLLAVVTGLTIDGKNVTNRNALAEQGKDLYGLEWFDPSPPGSISSVYMAMTDQMHKKGNGK